MHEENEANNLAALNLSDPLLDSSILQNFNTQFLSEQSIQNLIRSEQLALTGKVLSAKAHELNNSLQFIQCYLDLLLDFDLEDGSRNEYLNLIREEIQRLRNTNDTILNFPTSPSPANQHASLEMTITYILSLIEYQLNKRRITMTTDINADHLPISSDELTQVLLNLIINAIEAIDMEGKLHISSYAIDDEIRINVTNSGPPIPDSIFPKIFDPFFTTKPDGSGLGLWICCKILQQNFGDIYVKNLEQGCGVAFLIHLPLTVNQGVA